MQHRSPTFDDAGKRAQDQLHALLLRHRGEHCGGVHHDEERRQRPAADGLAAAGGGDGDGQGQEPQAHPATRNTGHSQGWESLFKKYFHMTNKILKSKLFETWT